MQQESKAWIFVSHSLRDLETVRRVLLQALGL